MRGEIINEYLRLDSENQKTFLWANAVVLAILLAGPPEHASVLPSR